MRPATFDERLLLRSSLLHVRCKMQPVAETGIAQCIANVAWKRELKAITDSSQALVPDNLYENLYDLLSFLKEKGCHTGWSPPHPELFHFGKNGQELQLSAQRQKLSAWKGWALNSVGFQLLSERVWRPKALSKMGNSSKAAAGSSAAAGTSAASDATPPDQDASKQQLKRVLKESDVTLELMRVHSYRAHAGVEKIFEAVSGT